jgi:hypothetical protein
MGIGLRACTVIRSGSNELACRTIAANGSGIAVGAHLSTRAANAAGSIVESLFEIWAR